jgi:hypothetical protein
VERTLVDYLECDWAAAVHDGTGSPTATVISLYKFIEFEMGRLHLFSSKKTVGIGFPDELTEQNRDEVKDLIETIVYKKVSVFNRSLWPIFSSQSWNAYDMHDRESQSGKSRDSGSSSSPSHSTRGSESAAAELADKQSLYEGKDLDALLAEHSDGRTSPEDVREKVSAEKSMHMRLAYMRFVTMKNLGLTVDTTSFSSALAPSPTDGNNAVSGSSDPETELAADPQDFDMNRQLVEREEWYLAIRSLTRAMLFETPSEILSKLVSIVQLVSHAVDALMNRSAESTASTLLTCARCGGAHVTASAVYSNSTAEASLPTNGDRKDVSKSSNSDNAGASGTERAESQLDPQKSTTSTDSDEDRVVASLLDAAILKCETPQCLCRGGLHLSADDLMPAITWVLIQVADLIAMCS